MSTKDKVITALTLLGLGIISVMLYMAYQAGDAGEAGGWIAAGYMALREVVSKLENVALGVRGAVMPPDEGG